MRPGCTLLVLLQQPPEPRIIWLRLHGLREHRGVRLFQLPGLHPIPLPGEHGRLLFKRLRCRDSSGNVAGPIRFHFPAKVNALI